jgi:predicted chitinase
LCCVAIVEAATGDDERRMGKEQVLRNRLVTGEAANNQRPGGDPVVVRGGGLLGLAWSES